MAAGLEELKQEQEQQKQEHEQQLDGMKLEYNEKINSLDHNINHLEKCLRDKDYRLKKVEGRWITLIWALAIVGLVVLGIALFVTILHTHDNMTKTMFEYTRSDGWHNYNISDWWLLIGSILIDVLAFIGLFGVFILGYALLKPRKKEN